MGSRRYAESRQKSCQQCSKAKAKCDRNPESCSRCIQRKLRCTYPSEGLLEKPSTKRKAVQHNEGLSDPSSELYDLLKEGNNLTAPVENPATVLDCHNNVHEFNASGIDSTPPKRSYGSPTYSGTRFSSEPNEPGFNSVKSDTLIFADLNLVCPINATDISNRWLNYYVPLPGQKVKNYPPSISSFIYKILNSYTTVVVNGRGAPPFIHWSQTTRHVVSPPLSTCLSLVRVCDKQLPGAIDSTTEILQHEMNRLYQQHKSCDDVALLATYQAYLIYAMTLFFQLGQASNPYLRQAMTNLQELACATSQSGLVCFEEQEHNRPRWEAWIVVESKRRALYTMYLFDSLLSTQDGLPTYLGTELEGLPSSANRILWQARSRSEWQKSYNMYLSDWPEGFLCINELWPMPTDFDAVRVAERNTRVGHWLENLDEFGIMLYTVTSCTHGS